MFGFRPTRCLRGDNNGWLARQFSDPYVKKRAMEKMPSRAAFKLLEMEEQHRFLDHPDVRVVVDLGAAPGGWSQAVSRKLGLKGSLRNESGKVGEASGGWSDSLVPKPREREKKKVNGMTKWVNVRDPELDMPGKAYDPLNIDNLLEEDLGDERELPQSGRGLIIAVDLDHLHWRPPGVYRIQGDFLQKSTEKEIERVIRTHANLNGGKVDVVLSDMAANVTGNKDADIQNGLQLCYAAFGFARKHLRSAASSGRELGGALLYVRLCCRLS